MVSLDSGYVSPVEVLVELVTRPSDGEHLFLDLFVSRFCVGVGKGSGSITNRLAILQQYSPKPDWLASHWTVIGLLIS